MLQSSQFQFFSATPATKRFWLNGDFVHAVLHKRKIKHHHLAKNLRVSGSSVHAWIENKRRIPRAKLELLSKILNVPAGALVSNEVPHA